MVAEVLSHINSSEPVPTTSHLVDTTAATSSPTDTVTTARSPSEEVFKIGQLKYYAPSASASSASDVSDISSTYGESGKRNFSQTKEHRSLSFKELHTQRIGFV